MVYSNKMINLAVCFLLIGCFLSSLIYNNFIKTDACLTNDGQNIEDNNMQLYRNKGQKLELNRFV